MRRDGKLSAGNFYFFIFLMHEENFLKRFRKGVWAKTFIYMFEKHFFINPLILSHHNILINGLFGWFFWGGGELHNIFIHFIHLQE